MTRAEVGRLTNGATQASHLLSIQKGHTSLSFSSISSEILSFVFLFLCTDPWQPWKGVVGQGGQWGGPGLQVLKGGASSAPEPGLGVGRAPPVPTPARLGHSSYSQEMPLPRGGDRSGDRS